MSRAAPHCSWIAPSEVRRLFDYDPASGELRWRQGVSYRRGSRLAAGSVSGDGYMFVKIEGKKYLLHRIIWVWMTGFWVEQVDHRDTVRTNNVWTNLRSASPLQNAGNRSLPCNNTSGIKGVGWDKRAMGWRVRVGQKEFGTFDTLSEARHAREVAAEAHFGKEYARHS